MITLSSSWLQSSICFLKRKSMRIPTNNEVPLGFSSILTPFSLAEAKLEEAKTDVPRLKKWKTESWPLKCVGDQPRAGVNGLIIKMEMLPWGTMSTQMQAFLCRCCWRYAYCKQSRTVETAQLADDIRLLDKLNRKYCVHIYSHFLLYLCVDIHPLQIIYAGCNADVWPWKTEIVRTHVLCMK